MTVRFTLERRRVQIGAKAQGGRVAFGVAIGKDYAAAVVTPRKADALANDLMKAAGKLRAAAAAAKRQRPGLLRRFLPWGRG